MFALDGMRNNELCNLRTQDIDLDKKTIYIFGGKGNKHRLIGIPEKMEYILREYMCAKELRGYSDTYYLFVSYFGEQLNPVRVAERMRDISERSGIKATPHALRRTFATLNAEQGAPLHEIQQALGHTDIRTTQGYLIANEKKLVQDMREWNMSSCNLKLVQ